jgi:uncharacterized peroxidase-related enzyme
LRREPCQTSRGRIALGDPASGFEALLMMEPTRMCHSSSAQADRRDRAQAADLRGRLRLHFPPRVWILGGIAPPGGSMSYLRSVPLDERTYPPFSAIKEQFGFIPNFYRAQTMRTDLIEAQIGLVAAILIKDGALSRRQKEYAFLVCSAANLSTYCVTAHCEIVRLLGLQGPEPEEIALDHEHADLPAADKALLDFVRKLTLRPSDFGRQDIDRLRAHGFNDEQILEAVLVMGLAKYANFVAFGLGTVPDFDASRIEETLKASRTETGAPALPAE